MVGEKTGARALPKSYETLGVSTFLVHRAARGIRARLSKSFNNSRASHRMDPCQIISCGPHARVRRARMSKSIKNHSFVTISKSIFTNTYKNMKMLSPHMFKNNCACAHFLNHMKPFVVQHSWHLGPRGNIRARVPITLPPTK